MEITNIPQRSRVVVPAEEIKPNDIIYMSDKPDAKPWLVVDASAPFIMIENLTSHFLSLYHVITPIYKDI